MKIAIAHPSLNACGGAELLCISLMEALKVAGNEVVIFTVERTDWILLRKIYGDITHPNKEIYLLPSLPKIPSNILYSIFLLSLYTILLFILKLRGKCDLVISTCGEKIDSIADIVYFNSIPLRCVYSLSNISVKRKMYGKALNLFLRIIDFSGKNRLLLVNSKFNRDIIKKILGRKAQIVYPPVNLKKFHPINRRVKSENLVVVISRFLPEQNLDYVPVIAKLVPNSKFVMIGPCSTASKNTLRKINELSRKLGVRDRVKILVNQPFSKYLNALLAAKVLFRTQPYEPFSMAIVEAMAAGCVPVVPRCGGPWFDILDREEGKYGYSYGSLKEAAEKIELLLRDEGLRRSISLRAAERAEKFDASIFQKKIVDIIERFVRYKH